MCLWNCISLQKSALSLESRMRVLLYTHSLCTTTYSLRRKDQDQVEQTVTNKPTNKNPTLF